MDKTNFTHGDMTVWIEPEEEKDAAVTHELRVDGQTVSTLTMPAGMLPRFAVLARPATAPKKATR